MLCTATDLILKHIASGPCEAKKIIIYCEEFPFISTYLLWGNTHGNWSSNAKNNLHLKTVTLVAGGQLMAQG